MPGLSHAHELAKIRWPDAELESVAVDYDAVSLRVRESSGALKTLRVEGYIGYGVVGFWDEIVIERAEISDTHPGLEACVASLRTRLGANPSDSGNEARNERRWFALSIHLLDGAVLEVFGARLRVDPSGQASE